MDSFDPPPEA
ncbi:hypothetical protein D9619_012539 [Psilocybe cf. subviscida]|uniref:Uncharacterized protein n=1 Tax=Psilocybe cf. subviscida TaxID=2480587 RepID=A0A8H5EZ44_9AGAR|nr:hypothetical protein D9619_012539 [Psilocybe cf. subviscida]